MTAMEPGAGEPSAAEPALSPTELRNPASTGLDGLSTLAMLELMNDEDARAIAAVRAALPALAMLVDAAVSSVVAGGGVHYFGAGTSGRLGILDAAELLPTFDLEPGVVTAHIAGGERAIAHAVEGSEDSERDGAAAAASVSAGDVAIGLAASGATPYVAGALAEARERSAVTALITSNPAPPLAHLADHLVALDTGPEVLTGSTRLKAGTAEKVALNGFSTALMVRLGRTWSNLMVSMVATNDKLRRRAVRILVAAAEGEVDGVDERAARDAIADADGDLRVALVAVLGGGSSGVARATLSDTRGDVRAAVARLRG